MSVMSCARNGCKNIMCYRSCRYGYICNECFDELVLSGPETNLELFMKSIKTYNCEKEKEAAFARFDIECSVF